MPLPPTPEINTISVGFEEGSWYLYGRDADYNPYRLYFATSTALDAKLVLLKKQIKQFKG